MILHIRFRVNKETALEEIERSGIKTSNEPRCIDEKEEESTWVIYTAKSNHLRWKMVRYVTRISNAMTKQVFYDSHK